MIRRTVPALLTMLIFTACARPTPERQVVDDAAAALGGAERLLAVRTVVIEGEGTHYNLGQDIVPGASGQTFAVTQYKRAIDVPGERARTELARVPNLTAAEREQICGRTALELLGEST